MELRDSESVKGEIVDSFDEFGELCSWAYWNGQSLVLNSLWIVVHNFAGMEVFQKVVNLFFLITNDGKFKTPEHNIWNS